MDMMFLMEKISESTFKIKSLMVGGSPLKSKNKRLSNNSFKSIFEFSNYKENYVKNKQYFNENLPNYGYPFDNLFKEIESQYKEKFISEIINSSRIPENQKVITTLGFKCDNETFDSTNVFHRHHSRQSTVHVHYPTTSCVYVRSSTLCAPVLPGNQHTERLHNLVHE